MTKPFHGLISRRDFVKGVATLSASSALFPGSVFAGESQKIRIALIGCGGRGLGALDNCITAAAHLGLKPEVTALADWYEGNLNGAINRLSQGHNYTIERERCHSGPAAYRAAIASEADVVLIVTPPNFRPLHFEEAVKAGKHTFIEKPVAVDPPGARRVIAAGKLAAEKGLSVVAGTQRRHAASYRQTKYAIDEGVIGPLRGGRIMWCQGSVRPRKREAGESDLDFMIRSWLHLVELSGDHIVEQHVHNIDVANWFIGRLPQAAVGFGGRARRDQWSDGNQFDFFSVDFDYGEDVHVHSMCRQVPGCHNRTMEHFVGAEGATFGSGPGGAGFKKTVTLPEFEEHAGGPLVQEHVHLLRSIIDREPINEAVQVAESTLVAIMGRISAYSGEMVRWRDLTDEKVGSPWYHLTLTPTAEDFESGDVTLPAIDAFPVPGSMT